MITNLKHLSELKNEQQQHNKHCAQLRPHKHAVRLVFNDKYLLEFHKIKDFQPPADNGLPFLAGLPSEGRFHLAVAHMLLVR
jgi:hypothetical protein